MKIICIMQARMGSSRLKGKVLKTICDQTVLEHDIDRLKKSKNISDIIVATTTKEEDDVIVKMSQKKKVKFYRGSEDNVLERYYFAAKDSNADVIVRVTSDCPCMDYNVIDNVIDLLDECGETYFKYCALVGDYILKKSDNKVILTEVDDELFFQDSSTREEFESLKAYKKDQEEKLNS